MKQILFYLKVSRPGLWFATLWLYLLPTGGMTAIWSDPTFWLGFVYCTFPLNFLVYGWNDIVDREIDAKNPRKDSFLFGARGTEVQLAKLWLPIVLVQIVFLPMFLYLDRLPMFLLLVGLIGINWAYNLPIKGLRSRPPFELLCQIGYLLVVPLSVLLNDTASIQPMTYCYLLLFAFQSHLIGEVMDIEPDIASGRRTTATVIGMRKTKLLIIGIVTVEVAILIFYFKAYIFGGMLGLGLCWFIADLFLIYKTNQYTLGQMKFFGFASNAVAFVTMTYVWYSGCLL